MKTIALIIVFVATAAGLSACGPSTDMTGMDKKAMSKDSGMKGMDSGEKTQGTAHTAVGVVKNVDPAKSTVTLAHEPVKSLNWPAMTMGFTVKDKALLDKLKADKKIEFEFVQQGKDYVITSVK